MPTRSHTPGGENGAKIPRVKRKSEHNVPGSSEVYISPQNHWYSLKKRNCFFHKPYLRLRIGVISAGKYVNPFEREIYYLLHAPVLLA